MTGEEGNKNTICCETVERTRKAKMQIYKHLSIVLTSTFPNIPICSILFYVCKQEEVIHFQMLKILPKLDVFSLTGVCYLNLMALPCN